MRLVETIETLPSFWTSLPPVTSLLTWSFEKSRTDHNCRPICLSLLINVLLRTGKKILLIFPLPQNPGNYHSYVAHCICQSVVTSPTIVCAINLLQSQQRSPTWFVSQSRLILTADDTPNVSYSRKRPFITKQSSGTYAMVGRAASCFADSLSHCLTKTFQIHGVGIRWNSIKLLAPEFNAQCDLQKTAANLIFKGCIKRHISHRQYSTFCVWSVALHVI